jgi:protein SCO1/2
MLLSGISSGETINDVKPEIREKLGHEVPPELIFRDERGNRVVLKTLIDRPTIVSLVYFRCGHACPVLLGCLAGALGRIEFDPVKDYRAITISFDDGDTPEVAIGKKRNYVMAVGKPYPEDAWKFLTGDEGNIRKLTEALGFEFKKRMNGFDHPKGLIFLSADGKVRRYLYGTSFSPFDIKMALAESAHESGNWSGGDILLFSFSYDRRENTYHFNIVKVFAAVSLFFIASLALFSRVTRKKSLGERVG